MKCIWVQVGVLLSLGMQLAFAEETCGNAKILSGSACSNLVVVFRLKGCGGGDFERAKIQCENEAPKAFLKKENGTFFIPLREIAPGVWTLVGSLRKYPKDWNPENKLPSQIVIRQASPDKADSSSGGATLEMGGQFRFRVEENRKRDLQSQTGFSSLRLRPHFEFRPNSQLEFAFMPQAIQTLGKPELLPSTPSSNSLNSTSGASRDPQLSFHQAYAQLQIGEMGRLLLGRQMFSYGDEVLVGPSDWENPGRSFDGIRLRFQKETIWWDFFSTKLWESNSQESAKGDRDFHGTYVSWNQPQSGMRVEPYFFWLRDHLSSLRQIYTAGIYASGLLSGLEMKTEASGQWGEQPGQQIWLGLGNSELFQNRFQVRADGFWASENFNPLFPSLHHLLGWADVLGRRNLAGLGLTLGWMGIPGVEIQIRGLHFLRVNTQAPPYASDGATPLSFSSDTSQELGSEIDLRAEMALFSAAHLECGAAVFFPGPPLRQQLGENWAGRFETSLIAHF